MKTSKKILITITGLLIVTFIAALLILKRDINKLLEDNTMMQYQEVPVNSFSKLVISANCEVTIMQGRNCKVEFAFAGDDTIAPKLEHSDDTLFLKPKVNMGSEKIHTRITAPVLHLIEASGQTSIEMRNYWTDSLTVELADSSQFRGSNNDITHITYRADR